ncbi:MAG: hypothetical protein KAS93_06865 [Gammaproteobacteria bacterium]|nr:hypothetical protein [Gammaproteobacteria bacterium]
MAYTSRLQKILLAVIRVSNQLADGKVVRGLSAHSSITHARLPMSRFSFFGNNDNQVAIVRDDKTSKIAGLELLRKKGVTSQFHGRYLYTSKHTLISPLHACDLLGYLERLLDQERILTADDIQRLFAQLVLAVEVLHDKNIVHNDFKLENVLITDVDGIDIPQLSLIDWDDVSLVDDAGFAIEGELTLTHRTHGCTSIEMEAYLVASSIKNSFIQANRGHHVQQYLKDHMGIDELVLPNSKSNDCFALGVALYSLITGKNDLPLDIGDALLGENKVVGIESILEYDYCLNDYRTFLINACEQVKSLPVCSAEHQQRLLLTDLALKLLADEPRRLSVKQIKEHKSFGNTPAECEKFFNDVEQTYKHKNHIQVNGYRLTEDLQPNCKFYLLPEDIQDFYADVLYIDTLCSYLVNNNTCQEVREGLLTRINQANADIESLCAKTEFLCFHNWLNKLRVELKSLADDFSAENKDQPQEDVENSANSANSKQFQQDQDAKVSLGL